MIFINDLAAPYAWMTPAPIGTVEHGWIEIVSDLLRVFDDAVSACPEATLDVLEMSERDGDLLFEFVIDGTTDAEFAASFETAVATAKIRAAATCSRCGRPRYARRERPERSLTRCGAHASDATRKRALTLLLALAAPGKLDDARPK